MCGVYGPARLLVLTGPDQKLVCWFGKVAVQVTVLVGAVPVPTNTNAVDWPALSWPFHCVLVMVIVVPEELRVPDHELDTVPPEGSVNVVCHVLIADEPAVTVTDAW